MPITNKDIIIIILGSIIGLVTSLITTYPNLISKLKFNDIYMVYFIILLISIGNLIIIWIFNLRIKELEISVEKRNKEKNKFEEKFKIYERLSKLENEVFNDKKRH